MSDNNRYRVKTEHGDDFTVDASDSDFAVWNANYYAKKHSVPSGKAELLLIIERGESRLGDFELKGHILPSNWAEMKDLLSRARNGAKADAKESSDYPCHRSRGVMLTAEDDKGEMLVCSSDSWDFPKTLKEFRSTVSTLKDRYPNLVKIWAECGYDSAASVRDFESLENYDPWTGEYMMLAWHKDISEIA